MSVRKIEFLVSADSVAPETVVCGGRQYEHNATQIDFVIDDDLYELLSKHQESGNLVFRIDALNGEGGYIPLGSVEPINFDGKIVLSYKIGYEITSVGGRCKFTIVASCIDEQSNREEMIFCSADAIVEFDAVSRNDGEHKEFEKGLSSILSEAKGCLIETAYIQDDGRFYIKYANGKTVNVGISNLLSADRIKDAVEATKAANTATENAINATQSANDAADDARNVRQGVEEGGFIESLKELNEGNKFTFWVGTKAEYEAIPENERVQNCFYMITDDMSAAEIKESINSLKVNFGAIADYPVEQGYETASDGTQWKYRKWSSGEVELWTKLELVYASVSGGCICEKSADYPFDITAEYLFATNNYAKNTEVARFSDVLKIRDGGNECVAFVYDHNGTFAAESEPINCSVYVKGTWNKEV